MIEILSCASMKNFCIIMFRSKNFEIKIYLNRIVNALFYDMMNLNETFRQISRHFNHFVKSFVMINDKTFVRQIINLNKLYKKKYTRNEKKFFRSNHKNRKLHKRVRRVFDKKHELIKNRLFQFKATRNVDICQKFF